MLNQQLKGSARKLVVTLKVVRFSSTGSLQKKLSSKMQIKTFYNNKKSNFLGQKREHHSIMFLNNPEKLLVGLKPTINFRFRRTMPLAAFMNCSSYEYFEYLTEQKNAFYYLVETSSIELVNYRWMKALISLVNEESV